jgi:hypothetical protein
MNRRLDEPIPLAQALRMAAAVLDAQTLPPDLQGRVLAAVRRTPRVANAPALGPRRRWGGGWAWTGAAASVAVLSGAVLLGLRPQLPQLLDDGVRASGFLPLAPPEHWPRDSAQAWLVSTELQGERLSALGLPFDPARAGDSVRAELLLHPSGEVLAVRFVP